MSNKNRAIFSISSKYETEVNNILNKIPNKSEFICEAILEKYNTKNKDNDDLEGRIEVIVYNTLVKFLGNNIGFPKDNKINIKNDTIIEEKENTINNKNEDTKELAKKAIKQW